MNTIFAPKNQWGFKYNVNHPYIKPLFREYCRMANNGQWKYPVADLERRRFECIADRMMKLGAEMRKEYFEKVLKSMKPLDFNRIRENKRADCIITAKLLLLKTVSPQKTN